MTPRPLEELIALEHTGEYREDLASITGSRSDREIGSWVEELVGRELGESTQGGLFVDKSVGAVFGLQLGSGQRVVLKLFNPRLQSRGELEAVHRCLTEIVARGFPAPRILAGLFQADERICGAFYQFLAGEPRDGHEPVIRRELARALAELVTLSEGISPLGLPLAPTRATALWPPSHRSFVKLESEPAARWIDEIAAQAQLVVRASPPTLVPAHLDWGAKNSRFRANAICAVFDWDSLHAASEPELVGRASAQFPTQWGFPGALTPSAEESAAFVEDYASARGRSFSSGERRVISAAADYLIAQIARQEQAGGGPPIARGFLSLLRTPRPPSRSR